MSSKQTMSSNKLVAVALGVTSDPVLGEVIYGLGNDGSIWGLTPNWTIDSTAIYGRWVKCPPFGTDLPMPADELAKIKARDDKLAADRAARKAAKAGEQDNGKANAKGSAEAKAPRQSARPARPSAS